LLASIFKGGRVSKKYFAPQKQNAICKPRAQHAKRNCKAHCATTINAKNASLKKKKF
jgi:hypothetical protein